MLLLSLLACFNDCSYYERCDGSTLLVCGDGVDQQFGREENPVACEAPNDVCVDVGDANATCAHAAEPCEAGTAPTCDGDVLLECKEFQSALGLYGNGTEASFLQATDCAASELFCIERDGTAGCVVLSPEAR